MKVIIKDTIRSFIGGTVSAQLVHQNGARGWLPLILVRKMLIDMVYAVFVELFFLGPLFNV